MIIRTTTGTGSILRPGVDGREVVDAIAVGNRIYAVGIIDQAGGIDAFNFAIYDDETRQWGATLDGPNNNIWAISHRDNRLYIGGQFTQVAGEEADYMAIWNLSTDSWEPFNEGVSGAVRVIYIVGDEMFIGGEFSAIGDMEAGGIARYSFTTGEWDNMGGGLSGFQGRPYEIRSDGDMLYVVGSFSEAGGVDSPRLAVYDMQSGEWSTLGTETSGTMHAIEFDDDYIYFGGQARVAPDGSVIPKLFRYDREEGTFSGVGAALPSGADPRVSSLLLKGEYLYAGGNRWDEVDGDDSMRNLARIHLPTEKWEALTDGTGDTNFDFSGLLEFNGDVISYGRVNWVNGAMSGRFVRWKTAESRLEFLGEGLSHGQRRPNALARAGDHIYIGGELFRSSAELQADRFAAFSPGSRSWIQTHSGWLRPNGGVEALMEYRGIIYVGGNFTQTGQNNGNNLATYDPADHEWIKIIPDGESIGGRVLSFAADGDDMYIAGGFQSVAGTTVNYITRYHIPSGEFHPVGEGTDGWINDILIHDGYIYAGGRFEQAGGEPAVRVARFDLQNQVWESVSTVGPNEEVLALYVYDNHLYVGGRFTNLDAGSGQFVARKSLSGDGDWESVGTRLELGTGFRVVSITDFDGAIHIGGRFDGAIDGTELNNIARLSADETEWIPLGSGVDGQVNDMLVWETDLWVTGNFGFAGGKPAAGFTVWSTDLDFMPPVNIVNEPFDLPQSVELDQNYPNPFNPATTIHYTLPERGHVQLEVFNVAGQRVATLVDTNQPQGTHTAVFDGSGLASGVYMYRITVNGQALARKMTLVK
jgi:trimeric autotransporter adhesin